MRVGKTKGCSTGRVVCRRGALLALGALLIGLGAAAPAGAHPFAHLSGGVALSCERAGLTDRASADLRAEVRNAGSRPIVLTHAFVLFQVHHRGDRFWGQPSVINLLEDGKGKTTAKLLAPGEQVGNVTHFDLVEGIAHVRAILLVHVLGEPFWRFDVDVDACD